MRIKEKERMRPIFEEMFSWRIEIECLHEERAKLMRV
jgi:hypothetical protein